MTKVTKTYFKEKLTVTYLLSAIFVLIVVDISLDITDGLPTNDIFFDFLMGGAILFLVLFTTNYIWKKFTFEKNSKKTVELDLEKTKHLATVWEKKSKQFVIEFQGHVSNCFLNWNLSKSEREIAILILQGKSSKEIFSLRFTSERTIRNQCRSIYEKASLSGRSELSAYFLNEIIGDFSI